MLQQALEQLLAAVQQKAPQLSSEDVTKVVNNLLVWMSESLDGIPEFRDMVEGLEYDKVEAFGEWDVRGEGIEDWWYIAEDEPDDEYCEQYGYPDETTSPGK